MTRYDQFKICDKNGDERNKRSIQIKYYIEVIVQETVAAYVAFIVQSHNKFNIINIDNLPFQFLL